MVDWVAMPHIAQKLKTRLSFGVKGVHMQVGSRNLKLGPAQSFFEARVLVLQKHTESFLNAIKARAADF
jgi:diaminopimelate decarboxylase